MAGCTCAVTGHGMMAAVLMLLIRHADAGSRRDWAGDDRDRPLTEAGVRQARDLASVLAKHNPALIATSPYQRCLQTVVPLAQMSGLPVVPVDDLGVQGAPHAGRTLRALARSGTGPRLARSTDDPVIAVCTHGEVIAAGLRSTGAAELADGAEIPGPKGGTWLLSFTGDVVVSAELLPPPS
ncbi:MAG: phosphoglycerate mutase family protein [Actinomycetota bacterium]|nr:phosphoglycerate mutase family protein [Actinomycetota bacterium]